MPRYILKATRDRDAYIEWSTVVDAAVSFGTRADYVAQFGEERIARTDTNGTSAMFFDWLSGPEQAGGWDDDELIVMEGSEVPGVMPRERLGDLYDLLINDVIAKIPAAWVTANNYDDDLATS